MSKPDRWFVWTGRMNGGIFPTVEHALSHCRTLTNDHRRKYEMEKFVEGGWRYVGPRGRRHGTRLVAFIVTGAAAEMVGIDVHTLMGNTQTV